MRAAVSGVIVGVLASTMITGSIAHAQPAGGSPAPPSAPPSTSPPASPSAADLARASTLYAAAQTAMAEGRYADAVRDYSEAHALTRDPVLFFQIGGAHEKAGNCELALIYFGRYLREARPAPEFVKVTENRIVACGGDPRVVGAAGVPPAASGSTPTPPTGALPPPAGDPTASATGSTAPLSGADPTARGGSELPAGPGPTTSVRAATAGPWLLVGGSVALLTIGAVLAYSANAAESDLSDLYVGLAGTPPSFDARTQKRYDDLIAEGERYEKLSWVSFGLAGALGIGAAVWFYQVRGDAQGVTTDRRPAATLRITPTVRRDGGGVAAALRF